MHIVICIIVDFHRVDTIRANNNDDLNRNFHFDLFNPIKIKHKRSQKYISVSTVVEMWYNCLVLVFYTLINYIIVYHYSIMYT